MKKLRMKCEDLRVESFSIRSGADGGAAGTVKAYAGDSQRCFTAFGCGGGPGDYSIQCTGTCDFTANADCLDTFDCP